MQMIVPELDKAGLRRFGLTLASMFVLLFGLILPYLFEFRFPIWPWALGAVLVAWSLVAPESLRALYRAWMRLALLLNRVTTPIVLGVVFFLVLSPLSLVMRVFGRDPLARSFSMSTNSYRNPSQDRPSDSLRNPF